MHRRRPGGRGLLPLALATFLLSTACAQEDVPALAVYRIVPVTTENIVVNAQAAGTVEPIQTVEVKSKASGEIIEVDVEVGDVVRRGDLLVRVDQRVPQNAVIQAEADLKVANAELENAEAQLERAEALHGSQVITEEEYEATVLTHAQAEAQQIRAGRALEDARIAFEDTEVRAPSDGIILSRQVEVGTVIQSASSGLSGGAVLLTMANLQTVQVRSFVDETDIGKIGVGMPVTITVEAFPNQPFEGEVLKVEPQALIQQNVTMFPVLVRIANHEGLLKPGMNAEVEVHIADRRDVLAVLSVALRTPRDIEVGATILGLDMETVERQLSEGLESDAFAVELASSGSSDPPQAAGASQTDRPANDRAPGGRGGSDRPGFRGASGFQFGGDYVVFVRRDSQPKAVRVQTGVTDLEYSEVLAGLLPGDSVYILPSADLAEERQRQQERVQERTQLIGGNSR